MSRALRIEYEGAFYHVTARGNEQKRIFFTKRDYEKFREYLKHAQDKFGYKLHCYALMTNHYHLMIETPQGNLKKVMHFINSSYTNYINIKRKRCGHLLQGRYKAIVVERDSYLMELSRYIHLNPVRAKMVQKPEEYPYSSFKSYMSKNDDDFIERELILAMMSSDKNRARKEYLKYVAVGIDQNVACPLDRAYAGLILGGTAFVKEVLNKIRQEDLEMEGITARRALQGIENGEGVLDDICTALAMEKDDITQTKTTRHRDLAIYAMKQSTDLSNKEIGKVLGGISSEVVSKANQRYMKKLKKDKNLNSRTQRVMSHVRA